MVISGGTATSSANDSIKSYDSFFHICDEACEDKSSGITEHDAHLIRVEYLMQMDFNDNREYPIKHLTDGEIIGTDSEIRINTLIELIRLNEVKAIVADGIEIMPMQNVCCSQPNIVTSTMDTHEFVASTGTCLFVRRTTIRSCLTCRAVHQVSEQRFNGCGRLHR